MKSVRQIQCHDSNSKFCCVTRSYVPVPDFAFPCFCNTATKFIFFKFYLILLKLRAWWSLTPLAETCTLSDVLYPDLSGATGHLSRTEEPAQGRGSVSRKGTHDQVSEQTK